LALSAPLDRRSAAPALIAESDRASGCDTLTVVDPRIALRILRAGGV
jgi:hypothetical protein